MQKIKNEMTFKRTEVWKPIQVCSSSLTDKNYCQKERVSCYTVYTGWRKKCHTIDCIRNTFLLLQKHLTSGTELILIGWKIVPNESL